MLQRSLGSLARCLFTSSPLSSPPFLHHTLHMHTHAQPGTVPRVSPVQYAIPTCRLAPHCSRTFGELALHAPSFPRSGQHLTTVPVDSPFVPFTLRSFLIRSTQSTTLKAYSNEPLPQASSFATHTHLGRVRDFFFFFFFFVAQGQVSQRTAIFACQALPQTNIHFLPATSRKL